MLEDWMKSYRPEELFDETGKLVPKLAALAPAGRPAHGRKSPRQRRLAAERLATCPIFAIMQCECRSPASTNAEATRVLGTFLRDVMKLNAEQPQLSCLRSR